MRPERTRHLRTLNRYAIERRTDSGTGNWSWKVRPRDFSTVLLTITTPAGIAERDVANLIDAVSSLCDCPAPPPRTRLARRRRKANG